MDELKKVVDAETCAVVVQHPNFFGCLEEVEALAAAAHAKGALFIVSFDPISLGLLRRPHNRRSSRCRRNTQPTHQSHSHSSVITPNIRPVISLIAVSSPRHVN